MLVGMGVAAAISAALHAPIAGVFLARELVLRRMRLSPLGPVAVASVCAWLIASWLMGGRPVIDMPDVGVILPTGASCGAGRAAAASSMFGLRLQRDLGARASDMAASRRRMQPAAVAAADRSAARSLGVIALAFPQVLGIGYEPLAAGLSGNYGAELMPVLALAKIAAAAVTFAFRWGGGADRARALSSAR